MTAETRRTATLDGLRGIAVLAVVIEHAWPDALPGGFAGVDVFFVLSGFLITRILVGELRRSGRIDLIGFYARRVRRIIPAAVACVAGTWLIYVVLLGPAFPDALRTQALAANFSVSNIYFWRTATDYFAADPSASPYLHFWSLAVEEQFYLVWPTGLLLLGLIAARLPRPRWRHWLPIAAIVALGIASLLLAMRGSQASAFFLLPHRSWELIVGGVLAWLQVDGHLRLPLRLVPFRWIGVVAGGVALGVVFALAPEFGAWPGPATILAVAGTALLVAGGDTMPGARVLAVAPLRAFGRISYALYLWHWPMLAAAALIALPATEPSLLVTGGAVLLAILVASASTLLLEEPIRATRRPAFDRRRGISLALMAVLVTGLGIQTLTGPATDAVAADSSLGHALAVVRSDRERLITDRCYSTVNARATPRECIYGAGALPDGGPTHGDPVQPRVAVLFGDSHAMHWFPLVDAWAREAGIALVPLVRSGCPAVDAAPVGTRSRQAACQKWLDASLQRIEELDPVVTIVSSSTGIPIVADGRVIHAREEPDGWVDPLARMLERVRAVSPSTLLIGDVPRPGFSVPDCLAVHRGDPSTCADALEAASPSALVEAQRDGAAMADVAFVDPGPWLCPGPTCTWMAGDRIGWVDDHHITASHALSTLEQWRPILDAAASP